MTVFLCLCNELWRHQPCSKAPGALRVGERVLLKKECMQGEGQAGRVGRRDKRGGMTGRGGGGGGGEGGRGGSGSEASFKE